MKDKGKWHLEFNNGLVPVLEDQSGKMVNESAIIAQLASDAAAPGQGLPLFPHEKDASLTFETADHRL